MTKNFFLYLYMRLTCHEYVNIAAKLQRIYYDVTKFNMLGVRTCSNIMPFFRTFQTAPLVILTDHGSPPPLLNDVIYEYAIEIAINVYL